MGSVFLNWKNPCHICQCHIFLIFQPHAKKIQIFFLSVFVILVLPEQAVPLVNQDNKRSPRMRINILHGKRQVFRCHIIRIILFQFSQKPFLKNFQHIFYIMCNAYELLHVHF